MREYHVNIRSVLLLAFLCLPIASSAYAEALIAPAGSLYGKARPGMSKDEIKALCAEILKRETSSKAGMYDASSLYLHGKILGVTCAKVDYYRSYTLAKAFGSDFLVRSVITFTRERANGGNRKAQQALARIEKDEKN